jgi:hypothetical protein
MHVCKLLKKTKFRIYVISVVKTMTIYIHSHIITTTSIYKSNVSLKIPNSREALYYNGGIAKRIKDAKCNEHLNQDNIYSFAT